eukprot:CAMPEP_0178557146 /NCGR_PEP_ID=MMETSP0697-20121206/9741_1 /TAXON_ID=265572 /ORGANISM="Extubocellulus spinifer, Strain CCMP396" /LENGTH=237 /DNA_ID=CAMNT_0020190203 /DNA_START=39 /DNA_END=752 /DNA_ORIENTATION=-
MAGKEDWYDVGCILRDDDGIHDWELLPKKSVSAMLGKANSKNFSTAAAAATAAGARSSSSHNENLTASISAEDIAGARGDDKGNAEAGKVIPDLGASVVSSVGDNEEQQHGDSCPTSPTPAGGSGSGGDKMSSSTVSTSASSTAGSGFSAGNINLSSAAVLASQANNAFIAAMDTIFDPDAVYPGGTPVHIRRPSADDNAAHGVEAVVGGAQKVVGNLIKHMALEGKGGGGGDGGRK